MRRRKITDAQEIIDQTITARNPKVRERIELEYVNAVVAQLIYEARTKAGLTQRQLAERVGTSQPVIARLEDSNYGGHSLNMLQRIATSLGKRLDLRLLPASPRPVSAA